MKKVMSVSVDEKVLEKGKDAAHEMRVSFSSFVEGAIKASVENLSDEPSAEKILDARRVVERAYPKNQVESDESLREEYKRTHPREMCPQCREKNKDCVCGR